MVGAFIVLAFVLGMVVGFAIMSNMNGYGESYEKSYAVRYYPEYDSYYVVHNGIIISNKYADKEDAKKRMEYYKERGRVK